MLEKITVNLNNVELDFSMGYIFVKFRFYEQKKRYTYKTIDLLTVLQIYILGYLLGVASKQLRLLHGRVGDSTTVVNSLSPQIRVYIYISANIYISQMAQQANLHNI